MARTRETDERNLENAGTAAYRVDHRVDRDACLCVWLLASVNPLSRNNF